MITRYDEDGKMVSDAFVICVAGECWLYGANRSHVDNSFVSAGGSASGKVCSVADMGDILVDTFGPLRLMLRNKSYAH